MEGIKADFRGIPALALCTPEASRFVRTGAGKALKSAVKQATKRGEFVLCFHAFCMEHGGTYRIV
jgi:hypothetical protein